MMPRQIKFRYEAVLQELQSFTKLFSRFEDGASEVDRLWRSLQIPRDKVQAGQEFLWIIEKHRPIRTRTSRREDAGREWRAAHAEVSMIWRLEQGAKRLRGPAHEFAVLSASTTCSIWEDGRSVASWNFDVGDEVSQGCRLHIQVHEHGIEVPRLPAVCVLPSDVLAFVMNELFPLSWAVAANSSDGKFHGLKQSGRLSRLFLSWAKAVEGAANPFKNLSEFREYASLTAE